MKTETLHPSFGILVQADKGEQFKDLSIQEIESLFKEHRTILFRGFETDISRFKAFTQQFTSEFSDYKGGGSRWKMIDRKSVGNDKTVMTTTGANQSFEIPLHGEMYYMDSPPEHIWFYGDVAPTEGGQTTICDGITLFENLEEEVQSFFLNNQIQYQRFLPDGVWQDTFLTKDVEEAKAFLASKKNNAVYDATDKSFKVTYNCHPLVEHTLSRKRAFINNILYIYMAEWAFTSGWIKGHLNDTTTQSPIVVRQGDGSKIPYSIIESVMKTAAKITYNIDWQQGDLAMIDNTSVLHGRRETVDGVPRNILVRMGDPVHKNQVAASV
ncbi:TauD/TfdA family dioxygenase [uncultured Dokdonia sp.]|uniref:TauD/TfdA family dioxygenase n=1 Tax=uncultured Dokdonia sp. TaxID=575653 RepID=UPI00262E13F2|nr:TauD/TfdA family dioxygenase [uncultured Dokdonia sp.]